MDYGALTLNIERILKARGISKNQICKDLDIPRANFNVLVFESRSGRVDRVQTTGTNEG